MFIVSVHRSFYKATKWTTEPQNDIMTEWQRLDKRSPLWCRFTNRQRNANIEINPQISPNLHITTLCTEESKQLENLKSTLCMGEWCHLILIITSLDSFSGNRRSLIPVQSTKRNTVPIHCYVAICVCVYVSSVAPRPFDLRPSNFHTMTLPESSCAFWKKLEKIEIQNGHHFLVKKGGK